VLALKQAESGTPIEEEWCEPADVLSVEEEVW